LQQYSWPGNVRELLNVVERMMVLTDKNTLDADDLPSYIRSPNGRVSGQVSPAPATGAAPAPTAAGAPQNSPPPPAAPSAAFSLDQALGSMTLAELEDRAIAATLARCNNNRTRAARALGISVRTLQRKLGAKNPHEPADSETVPAQEEPAETEEPAAAESGMVGAPS